MTHPHTSRISPMTVADIPALVEVIDRAYRGDHPGSWTTEAHLVEGPRVTAAQLQELLDDATMEIFVARGWRSPNSVDGCIMLEMHPHTELPEMGLFAVEPSLQGSGVGRALITALEADASRRGFPGLTLNVIETRPELIAWYQRLGFEPTGIRVPFPGFEGQRALADGLHFAQMRRQF